MSPVMAVSISLRTLLNQSIDYAGMFPPCNLGLEAALKNHAQYVRSADSWMLGGFVLPIEQFDAAKQLLSEFDPLHTLRVAALGPKTATADAFLDALDDGHNSDEEVATFGYKLRTGGVTADAFPTSAQIADALVTPATHQLPIKFTAGLHHPIRQFRDEVKTKMHGFLNVLGAAVLAAEHQWDADQAVMMLEDEDPGSFSFTDDFFAWRDWKIDTERLQYRRKFVRSFGSCSFDEPRDDLRALGFL